MQVGPRISLPQAVAPVASPGDAITASSIDPSPPAEPKAFVSVARPGDAITASSIDPSPPAEPKAFGNWAMLPAQQTAIDALPDDMGAFFKSKETAWQKVKLRGFTGPQLNPAFVQEIRSAMGGERRYTDRKPPQTIEDWFEALSKGFPGSDVAVAQCLAREFSDQSSWKRYHQFAAAVIGQPDRVDTLECCYRRCIRPDVRNRGAMMERICQDKGIVPKP